MEPSEWKEARFTGYHPLDAHTSKEKALEGKPVDAKRGELHYLENYNPNKPDSYVTVASDLAFFKFGTEIEIENHPNVRFIIKDTGGGFIKKLGNKIYPKTKDTRFDIATLTRKRAESKDVTGVFRWRLKKQYEPGDFYQPKVAMNITGKQREYSAGQGDFSIGIALLFAFIALG